MRNIPAVVTFPSRLIFELMCVELENKRACNTLPHDRLVRICSHPALAAVAL
jgi:hypothetical protein